MKQLNPIKASCRQLNKKSSFIGLKRIILWKVMIVVINNIIIIVMDDNYVGSYISVIMIYY